MIVRASESNHWYKEDGTPCYTVKAKDGSDRPTTLRDAKKLSLKPSVTTIMKLLAKPGLDQWKQEQMLLSALTLPRLSGEDEKSWINRIVHDSKETARAAAERGTRIHESVERHFLGLDCEYPDLARKTKEAIEEYFGVHEWQTEVSFAHDGYAGKVDLFAPWIVLDVKTKEFTLGDKLPEYDEHCMQLEAYAHGLRMPGSRTANVFVSPSGDVAIKEWTQDQKERGWKMFQLLKELFYAKTGLAI